MDTLTVTTLLIAPISNVVSQTLNSSVQNEEEYHIAVISDVHVMAPSLLIEDGEAMNNYIAHDRKMLRESTVILKVLTDKLIAEHPQIVLITGDLTKDGESISHQYLIDSCLSRLKEAGIQPLVIPGNHDVNNPHSISFEGRNTKRVQTVSPYDFASIYAEYGYGKAIARDKHSLSYVFEPLGSHLRILAIDACKYEENDFEKNICRHDGRIKPETMNFIKEQITDAKNHGMRVIGMMHHGLVSHWKYQDRIMKGYLIDDWKKQADLLSKEGLEIMFTGHSHAQDISCRKKRKRTIYDVETGSAVTYPSPYRLICVTNDSMKISSKFIEEIPINLNGISFTEHAKQVLMKGAAGFVESTFPSNVPDSIKQSAALCAGKALIANCRGDEKLSDKDRLDIEQNAKKIKKYSKRYARIFRIVTMVMRNDVFPTDNEFAFQFTLQTTK